MEVTNNPSITLVISNIFFLSFSVQSPGEHTPPDVDIPPEAQPPAPSATLVENLDLSEHHEPENTEPDEDDSDHVKVKFETLRSVDQSGDTVDIDSHMSERVSLVCTLINVVNSDSLNFF